MSYWISLDYAKDNFWDIKKSGGVYAIYCDGVLLYIGQSANVGTRIASYRIRFNYGGGIMSPWGTVAKVVVKVSYGRRYGDWAMRELRLIRRIKPPQNCVGSVRKKRTAKLIPQEVF